MLLKRSVQVCMLDLESAELHGGEGSLGERCRKRGSLPRVSENACARLVGGQSSSSMRAHAAALSFLHCAGVRSTRMCLELLQRSGSWWSSLGTGETRVRGSWSRSARACSYGGAVAFCIRAGL